MYERIVHLQIPWKKQSITFCLSLCLASLERGGRAVVVVVVVVVATASVVGFVYTCAQVCIQLLCLYNVCIVNVYTVD